MQPMLRCRILRDMIQCLPWQIWKGEIDYLPVSSKVLFARNGLPIDILERELKNEGYLSEEEILLEVLKIPENLKRRKFGEFEFEQDGDFGLMPNDWTEEDYLYYEENKKCQVL